VHLVPLALQDVEQGLVLVAVPVVPPAGLDRNEMEVQALRRKGSSPGSMIFQFSPVPPTGMGGVNTRGTVRSRSRRSCVSE